MAEPLKAMYRESFLREFAAVVREAYPSFDTERFVSETLGAGWEELELKGRMRRITLCLRGCLPDDYPGALDVLEAIADRCRGFPYLFFPDFVEVFGLEHWERSTAALAKFTPMSSSEFAVRAYIKRDQARMLALMLEWSGSTDEHVRRLASEGCRPRLPWGDALAALKRDPAPILPILERLKDDPSEYVRRSVANNLNDISKDHPELVLRIAKTWAGRSAGTDWIVRHACRGLIRAAHPEAMALQGIVPQPGVRLERWHVEPAEVPHGGAAAFEYALRAPEQPAGGTDGGDGDDGGNAKLRIELAVSYPRQNGKSYRKVFKLSEREAPAGALLTGGRGLSFADLSTRRHYPGVHRLALIVNGEELAGSDVVLLPPDEEAAEAEVGMAGATDATSAEGGLRG